MKNIIIFFTNFSSDYITSYNFSKLVKIDQLIIKWVDFKPSYSTFIIKLEPSIFFDKFSSNRDIFSYLYLIFYAISSHPTIFQSCSTSSVIIAAIQNFNISYWSWQRLQQSSSFRLSISDTVRAGSNGTSLWWPLAGSIPAAGPDGQYPPAFTFKKRENNQSGHIFTIPSNQDRSCAVLFFKNLKINRSEWFKSLHKRWKCR